MKCIVCNVNDIGDKSKTKKCKKCNDREYREKNREKKRITDREYHKKNKDKRKEYDKKNRKHLTEMSRIYRQTEKGLKMYKISDWKKNGLVDSDNDNYDKIYQRYMDTANCDLCNVVLTIGKQNTSTTKCMEHDHKTGLFRNIVCLKCNVKIRDIETPCKSNTGIKNISFVKKQKIYLYSKITNGEKVNKYFKKLDEAICYSVINDMILKLENDN